MIQDTLNPGLYILKVSGYGNDHYHEFGKWIIATSCDKNCIPLPPLLPFLTLDCGDSFSRSLYYASDGIDRKNHTSVMLTACLSSFDHINHHLSISSINQSILYDVAVGTCLSMNIYSSLKLMEVVPILS